MRALTLSAARAHQALTANPQPKGGTVVRARFLRGLILALSSLSLIAAFSLTAPAAQAVPCNTWTVRNSGVSERTVTLSDNGQWHYASVGELLGYRTWDKIRVPAGSDIKLHGSGYYPDRIYKVNLQWYEPGDWNCNTLPDPGGANYWYVEVRNDGYFD